MKNKRKDAEENEEEHKEEYTKLKPEKIRGRPKSYTSDNYRTLKKKRGSPWMRAPCGATGLVAEEHINMVTSAESHKALLYGGTGEGPDQDGRSFPSGR